MIKHVFFAQFDCSLLVLHCESQDDALRQFYVYKKKCIMLERLDDHNSGWTQHYAGDIFVWYADPRVLVHELVHVAFMLCEIRGMKPDEEFIAYTTQYAYREVS